MNAIFPVVFCVVLIIFGCRARSPVCFSVRLLTNTFWFNAFTFFIPVYSCDILCMLLFVLSVLALLSVYTVRPSDVLVGRSGSGGERLCTEQTIKFAVIAWR